MIKIIGAGPGNRKYVTKQAIDEIKGAKKIYAFRRLAEEFSDLRKDIEIVERFSEVSFEEDSAVIASGDPMFFGIAKSLKNWGLEIEIIPGISSCQYFLNKLLIDSNPFNAISFHGRDFDIGMIKEGINVFFTDSVNTPDLISRKLKENGYSGYFAAGFNLSYEDEKIMEGKVGDRFISDMDLALALFNYEMD